jgi:2-polyprenyl-3-methyl-5-hydroxy-6-metoxy-1,4-benzoquinol methylase
MFASDSNSLDLLLEDIRTSIILKTPELLALFDNYASEARFGRNFIDSDLIKIPCGSSLLEVGAGSLILSCQLVREGYRVTALDPIGEGFSHFKLLRELVLERATELGCLPMMLNQRAEELSITEYFDYAFSINVMEHVHDIKRVIVNIVSSLRPAAKYRFTCPNYLFPYEPHFNIPTIFSKKLTERIFRKHIFLESSVEDATGTWNSLNWITVPKLTEIVRCHGIGISFNQLFFVTTLERIGVDTPFALRRSKWVRLFILTFLKMGIHRLARYIPVSMQPNMDCSLTKNTSVGDN